MYGSPVPQPPTSRACCWSVTPLPRVITKWPLTSSETGWPAHGLPRQACVADPAFHVQLEALLSQYTFTLVHFNNGLHGVGYTEEEYRAGYDKALKSIQKNSPSTKLVLALSTPLNETSQANNLNPRVTERNRIVSELAKTYGAAVNDLHSISKGHPEYYTDAYHYKAVAIELQGKQVADTIKEQLKGK